MGTDEKGVEIAVTKRKARQGKTDIWQKYLLGQAYHSASLQIIPVLD